MSITFESLHISGSVCRVDWPQQCSVWWRLGTDMAAGEAVWRSSDVSSPVKNGLFRFVILCC